MLMMVFVFAHDDVAHERRGVEFCWPCYYSQLQDVSGGLQSAAAVLPKEE